LQTLRELQKAKHAIKKAQKQSAAIKRSRYKLKQAEKEAAAAAEREHHLAKPCSKPSRDAIISSGSKALRCARRCCCSSSAMQDLNVGWCCADTVP